MVNFSLAWIALFSPLAACGIITLFLLRSKAASARVAVAGILISFVCTALLAAQIFHAHPSGGLQQSLPWIHFNSLTIGFGVLLNPLAIVMLLIVTGVGSAIFIYSQGYMADDPGSPRFFAFLSLFAFSMIGIVLSSNFIQLFVFWELVGLSSYLLIGFWYERPSAADAGVKAFIVNRLADFGFLCGILLLWGLSGTGAGLAHIRTFNFTGLAAVVPHLPSHLMTIAALLIFCGVVGKSAQVPLHVWLPDAMEGPTPVSALIHAATMVAAGIYLLARTFFIFQSVPAALAVIAYTGGITALLAATLAVAEDDIKRILAYSTLSQLGYMVMALGLSGPTQGMYHLTTHAFFKALLFLSAGSVICALHHEQNIWNMGGLLKKMPVTGVTFLIAALALSGIYPFSGFWSKDAILDLAAQHNLILYWMGSAAAGLTAFYMGRLFFVAFWGHPSGSSKVRPDTRESPLVMTIPMIFLAVLSAIGGFLGIPHWLNPGAAEPHLNIKVALTSSLVAVLGLAAAYALYGRLPVRDPLERTLGPFYRVLKKKYYFDIVYDGYVNRVQQTFAVLLDGLEKTLITGFDSRALPGTVRTCGDAFRRLQNGFVQFYALFSVLGVLVLFLMMVNGL